MLDSARDEGRLLGRSDELAAVESLLGAIDSRGDVLVLRGEPGIGKSRLLRAAGDRGLAAGVRVLSASGVQSETHLPFAGLHQLLRPIRRLAAGLPAVHGDALDAAFGLTHKPPPEPYRIALATLDLLALAAETTPVLLLVDDAHWLDLPTAEVLAFVARRIQSDPIVLLAAARDGYRSPLLGARLPEHTLSALDRETAASLLDTVTPNLPVAARREVLDAAAGNPLGIVELPATAGGDGALAALPLSDRLERAFAGRVAELAPATRVALLAAALDDGDRLGEVLSAASAVAGEPLDEGALIPAREAALVELSDDTVRFRHPLMRSAVVQAASANERRAVHAALADTLRSDPDRHVWHRAALVRGTDEQLACELEAAGMRAQRRGAIGVAFTALRRAVEVGEPARRPARIVAAVGLAYERGYPHLARPLLRELDGLELGHADAARARFMGELLEARALSDEDHVAELIDAAEAGGAAGDREVHHDLLWLLATRTWWTTPLPQLRARVVGAARRAGPPTVDDPRLVAIHAYSDPYGQSAAVVDVLRAAVHEGVTGAEEAGHLASAAVVTGAFHEGLACAARAVEGARAEGRLGALPRLLAVQAMLAVRIPDRDVAIPAAEEARRMAEELGQPVWIAAAETAISAIAAVGGDAEGAEASAARAEQIARPLGAAHLVGLAQFGPVLAALGAGRHTEALNRAERLFDPRDPAYHLHVGCMRIADLAEASMLAGEPETGRRRLEQVESLVAGAPAEWIAMSVRHARAVLAEGETEAAARFDDALAADLQRWPFWHGRLLLTHGRWLRRRRRTADSRAPLRAARDLFDVVGAPVWGEQARAELRASGESSRRRDPAARDALTAQELQIAQLAATGLTNREIGGRLYLSHRTVSTHLYRVFPKLGITSRAELQAALASGAAGD